MFKSINTLKFCLVTKTFPLESLNDYTQFVLKTIAGGVSAVQLRIKDLKQAKYLAEHFKTILTPLGIPLIINDHVQLAYEIDAAGVHLGQEDMPPILARKILGEQKIIGLSIENIAQLHLANQISAIDYVAASAIFPSKNKTDCKNYWGIDGLKNFVQQTHHPVIAIGGIEESNITEVIATGTFGVAVIGALHDAKNPQVAANQLRNQIYV